MVFNLRLWFDAGVIDPADVPTYPFLNLIRSSQEQLPVPDIEDRSQLSKQGI
jgi:hypothetical protein